MDMIFTSIVKNMIPLSKQYIATLKDAAKKLTGAKRRAFEGLSPVIKLVETAYQKGVRMTKKAFNAFANRIDRDALLPKYYVTIKPQA